MMDEPIVLGVFEELWRANARVRLPDTVIWKYGKVDAWFFTSRHETEDGPQIMRKRQATMRTDVTTKIFEAFCKGKKGVLGEVIARYIGAKSQGDSSSVVYLTEPNLHEFLFEQGAAEAKGHGVLQRWFRPPGENSLGVRCEWSTARCGVDARQNQHAFDDERVPLAERLATFEGPCRSASTVPNPNANLRRQAVELAGAAAAALDALLMPMRKVWSIELTLLPDDRGVYHLSWCSGVALAELGADGVFRKTYVTPAPERDAVRGAERSRRPFGASMASAASDLADAERESARGARGGGSRGRGVGAGADSAGGRRGTKDWIRQLADQPARQGLPPELVGVPLEELDTAEEALRAARSAEEGEVPEAAANPLARARELFDCLAVDGAGGVSRSELAAALGTDPQLEAALMRFDGRTSPKPPASPEGPSPRHAVRAKRYDFVKMVNFDAESGSSITWDGFIAAAGVMGIEAFWSTGREAEEAPATVRRATLAAGGPPNALAYVPAGYVPKPPPRGPRQRDGSIFHAPSLGMVGYDEPPWMSQSYAPEVGAPPPPPPPQLEAMARMWLPHRLRQSVFGEGADSGGAGSDTAAATAFDEATLARLAHIQDKVEAGKMLSADEARALRMCEHLAAAESRPVESFLPPSPPPSKRNPAAVSMVRLEQSAAALAAEQQALVAAAVAAAAMARQRHLATLRSGSELHSSGVLADTLRAQRTARAVPPAAARRSASAAFSPRRQLGVHLPMLPSAAELDAEHAARSAAALRRHKLAESPRGAPHVLAAAAMGLRGAPGHASPRAHPRLGSAPASSAARHARQDDPLLPLLPTYAGEDEPLLDALPTDLPRSMLRAVKSYRQGLVGPQQLFTPTFFTSRQSRDSARRQKQKQRRGLRLEREQPPPSDPIGDARSERVGVY